MLCVNCGRSEYDHEAGQLCPVGGTFYRVPANRYEEEMTWTPKGREPIRTFATGATRDVDDDKLDYEGFLSPIVIKRFGEYMHKNRVQKDGSLRASDNWQRGMPKDAYMKSGWRHFHEWWTLHREGKNAEEALCALLFNLQGYLHETLK